jgi:spore germination protein (amino acid permease)
MMLEKGRISSHELLFSVFCFMQGTMLRSGFIIGVTRNDSWLMALTGLAVSLVLVSIYSSLSKRFPRKNLFEISEIIFGKILGKIVSSLYVFFFLTLTALNTHDLGDFVVGYMIPKTPIAVITLLFILVCLYAVHKGIESFMRLSTAFCILAIGAVTINIILILKDIQFDYLKPFFQQPLMKYVQGTLTVVAIPMGEIIAFMAIVPMLGGVKPGKPLAKGLTLSALFLTAVMLRDIMTLGPMATMVSLPSYESVRYVSLAGILTRMESLYGLILIVLFLFKVCILLYASLLGLSQVLGFRSYEPLMLLCTAFIYMYSLFVFESSMENAAWGATTAAFFSLSFEFVLPIISLVTAAIRKLGSPKDDGEEAPEQKEDSCESENNGGEGEAEVQ